MAFALLYLERILTQHARVISRFPKGPRPWPFVGNIVTMCKLHSDTDKTLLQLAQKFGDVCMLWLGSWPVLIVNTARAAHELLHEVRAIPCFHIAIDVRLKKASEVP